jgi:alkanesulfonate monooxygenase SsuD/methylene tetrahydromethanopterin reductase-like flavin-dependent oxidoreductase (luciferase family)
MDHCLRIVRALLAGETVDHGSEFFHLEQARIIPTPQEPIPIVVGGRSSAATSRAGRRGDGWIGVWV